MSQRFASLKDRRLHSISVEALLRHGPCVSATFPEYIRFIHTNMSSDSSDLHSLFFSRIAQIFCSTFPTQHIFRINTARLQSNKQGRYQLLNTPDSYSDDQGFESRPGNCFSCYMSVPRHFSFGQILLRRIPVYTMRIQATI